MNTAELVQWQIIDPDNGLVMPWWTHPFLMELKKWKLDNVKWLEFGSGRSTAWLRSKCKWVTSIEANLQWSNQAIRDGANYGLPNGEVEWIAELADGIPEQMPKYFSMVPTDINFDIISVDGIYRYEALRFAIDHFKNNNRSGIIIADNFDQDYVWISPASVELMAPYEMKTFYQPNHTDHSGKPWNTRYWLIPKSC